MGHEGGKRREKKRSLLRFERLTCVWKMLARTKRYCCLSFTATAGVNSPPILRYEKIQKKRVQQRAEVSAPYIFLFISCFLPLPILYTETAALFRLRCNTFGAAAVRPGSLHHHLLTQGEIRKSMRCGWKMRWYNSCGKKEGGSNSSCRGSIRIQLFVI